MSTKTKFNLYYFILTPFLSLPSQPLLPSPLKLQNFTISNAPLMSACCVCRFGISFTYVVTSIDSKLISVCLINCNIFVYGRRMRFQFTRIYKGETSYIK